MAHKEAVPASGGKPPDAPGVVKIVTTPGVATNDDHNNDGKHNIAAPDPFAVENLRLGPHDAMSTGVKKLLLTVPVRKPDRQTFVRVHPNPAYHCDTKVLEVKEMNETYLVVRALWPALAGELTNKSLIVAQDRQKNVFVWPIRLHDDDGRLDSYNESAREAADRASKQWVRISANQSLRAYDVFVADADLGDPEWPDLTCTQILDIAFKGRKIESLDHPALRQLRGEM